jgi:hypothetical protein
VSSAIRNQRIEEHDLDIEYEVRVMKHRKRGKKTSTAWSVGLRTPHFKYAVDYYEKKLAEGKRVRFFKYTIEVVREQLFVAPSRRST